MTEGELMNQLRESFILDGPDAWRSNGYLPDAQRAGWKLVTALKRANDVNQEMSRYREWIENMRTQIIRTAQLSGPASDPKFDPIIQAAAALNLSADFVRNRWIPTELARLRNQPTRLADVKIAASSPNQPVVVPASPATVSVTGPAPVTPAVEPVVAPDTPPAKLPPASSDRIEPQPVVRSFTATPDRVRRGDSVRLAWAVDHLPTVTVDDLGSGLLPQHQAWVRPSKTTAYTLFDPDNKPLKTIRVEVVPRDRSVLYGVLGALVLIVGFLWYNNARSSERASVRAADEAAIQSRRPTKSSAGGTYDEVTDDADERGWRRARANGRWGFIDPNDEWAIPPQYDAVTPFRRGRAIVIRKGRLITINRDGEPVRN